MNLTEDLHAIRRVVVSCWSLILVISGTALMTVPVRAQGVTTTTVQGVVYLADGNPGSGTLMVRWPAFTTAAGQAVAAGSTTTKIPSDGFVSLNLAPNLGSTPAGQYYTVVLYLSDGSASTEYRRHNAAALFRIFGRHLRESALGRLIRLEDANFRWSRQIFQGGLSSA